MYISGRDRTAVIRSDPEKGRPGDIHTTSLRNSSIILSDGKINPILTEAASAGLL